MRVRTIRFSDLSAIAGQAWVDPSRRPVVQDGMAYVPVREGEPHDLVIPERKPYRGRGYQRLGDLILVHGKRPTQEELGEIVGWEKPRGVLWVRAIRGIERRPVVETLHGTAGEVCHTESGCRFLLDPARVMYAMGNLTERRRVAELAAGSGRAERIADLFAGIGYFTIPLARAGFHVHAMEISPVAHGYLVRNIRANRVEDRVDAGCGDCRDLLRGMYDRFILGHFDALPCLTDALAHARSGSVLHIHTLRDETGRIGDLAREAGFSAAVTTRRVKRYAPHTWHMVQDVTLS